MKKDIILLFGILFCVNIYAQCDYTNIINVSTGVDNRGGLLPYAVADPNWLLMNNAPLRSSCSATYSTMITPPQAWTTNYCWRGTWQGPNGWANLPSSRALAPGNIYSNTGSWGNLCGGDFDCNNANRSQPFVYDRPFCLNNSSQVTINVLFKGDDNCRVSLIDPNGNTVATAPGNGNHSGTTGNWNSTYNLTTLGTYRIRATNSNTGATTIGFSVSGTISTNTNVLSNSSTDCCRDYGITIQKILDNNCDGLYNSGDVNGGANWAFDILPINSTTPIYTGLTDNNGELIITGLIAGTYVVREQSNPLSPNNTPFNNNLQVSIGENNLVGFINFYNCPTQPIPPVNCCQNELNITKQPSGPIANIPNGANWTNGIPLSLATEDFTINNDAVIPITQLRAVVTDVDFEYDMDACAVCIDNPAHWASIDNGVQAIGSQNNGLDIDDYQGSILVDKLNQREVIWRNAKGALLKQGDTFKLAYAFPAFSEIPCCATKVTVCTEISWKDANCKVCVQPFCSTFELKE